MINKLILGTVQLGLDYGINNQSGKPSLEKAFEILHCAYDEGIRILDTAEAYGNSQEVIGKFQKSIPNKKFNIITKLSPHHSLKKNELYNHIKKDCDILGVENGIYGYMFHNYQSFSKEVHFYYELLLAKQKGLVKKAGISLYTNEEIEDVLNNYFDFDFIQIPFNLLDNASKRMALMQKAKSLNIEVHTRSVFLQGLFFKEPSSLPEILKPIRPYLEIIKEIKTNNAIKTEELALKYVLDKDNIDHVLIGVENKEQLMSNIVICEEKDSIPHELIDNIQVKEENLLNPSNWN